jgi:tetratricopeptide (TPR) repeat protein
MKKLSIVSLLLLFPLGVFAQSEEGLIRHYENYYEQMKVQGDVQGIINALTHLNVLKPNKFRKDTLAYVYASNNQHLQALNTIGIEEDAADSDLALQIKASSFKAINEPKRAIAQYELLIKRKPSAFLDYEIADLKIQIGDNEGALKHIDNGLQTVTDQMKYAFYERQQPYQVPLKAALLHIKGLHAFNINKEDMATAISYIDQALAIAPNFNLASLSKQALESRLQSVQKEPEN